jgi:hypothetical protein
VQRATCLVERSGKIIFFKKESDTHIFYLFFTTALVFSSSMHDRWNTQLFYKLLELVVCSQPQTPPGRMLKYFNIDAMLCSLVKVVL